MRTALVMGSSLSLTVDCIKAMTIFKPDELLAVNHVGVHYPEPGFHWVTNHPTLFSNWLGKRRRQTLPEPTGFFWCPEGSFSHPRFKFKTCKSYGGSSGLLAVRVALRELNCTHVVIAGMPMTKEGEHFDKRGSFAQAEKFQEAWEECFNQELEGKVKSMSGWTKDLLGEPTPEWFKS